MFGTPDPAVSIFRLLEYAERAGIGVMEWLIANGHGALTICPECHVTGFQHITNCALVQPSEQKFDAVMPSETAGLLCPKTEKMMHDFKRPGGPVQ